MSKQIKKPIHYPHLSDILTVIAEDNCMAELPAAERRWPKNAAILEREASRLTDEEKEVLGAGEYTEQQKIVEKKKVQKLNQFLCDAFDGPLTKHFFGGPTDYDN